MSWLTCVLASTQQTVGFSVSVHRMEAGFQRRFSSLTEHPEVFFHTNLSTVTVFPYVKTCTFYPFRVPFNVTSPDMRKTRSSPFSFELKGLWLLVCVNVESGAFASLPTAFNRFCAFFLKKKTNKKFLFFLRLSKSIAESHGIVLRGLSQRCLLVNESF